MNPNNSIQKAIDYIEEHITDELDNETIARQAAYSTFYFQHIFTVICGITVGDYIRYRRLTLAGHELCDTDIKIIDVAFKYGYSGPESFSRAFRKFHGVTPTEARKDPSRLKKYSPLSIKVAMKGGRVSTNEWFPPFPDRNHPETRLKYVYELKSRVHENPFLNIQHLLRESVSLHEEGYFSDKEMNEIRQICEKVLCFYHGDELMHLMQSIIFFEEEENLDYWKSYVCNMFPGDFDDMLLMRYQFAGKGRSDLKKFRKQHQKVTYYRIISLLLMYINSPLSEDPTSPTGYDRNREWPIEDLNYAMDVLNANSKTEDDIFICERAGLELRLATGYFRIGEFEQGFEYLDKYNKHIDIVCDFSDTGPRRGSVPIFEDYEVKLKYNQRQTPLFFFNADDTAYDAIREDIRFNNFAAKIKDYRKLFNEELYQKLEHDL